MVRIIEKSLAKLNKKTISHTDTLSHTQSARKTHRTESDRDRALHTHTRSQHGHSARHTPSHMIPTTKQQHMPLITPTLHISAHTHPHAYIYTYSHTQTHTDSNIFGDDNH